MSSENPSSLRPAYIELLRAKARGYPDLIRKASPARQNPAVIAGEETKYIFKMYTGNRWPEPGEREPDPQTLTGGFWHQNEPSILFRRKLEPFY